MKIGIDIRVLQTPILHSGIGIYTYNLVKNLLQIKRSNIVLYTFEKGEKSKGQKGERSVSQDIRFDSFNPEVVGLPRHRRHNWFFQQFPRFKVKTDVFHIPMVFGPSREIVLPAFPPPNTVVTVHDLIPLHFDDAWSVYLRNTKDFRLQLRGIKRVKRIIAVSKTTKDDLTRTLGVEDDKIEVIYEGVDTELFKPLPDKRSLREYLEERFNIEGRFLLCVGTGANKNLSSVVESFCKLQERGLQLVIVGNRENLAKDVVKAAASAKGIIFAEVVNASDLCILYNCAELLLFVSIMEGFGLPVLEAFACGCPVLTSNTSALPEVAGDAAVLVSPTDVEGITERTREILNDGELRKSLTVKGLERAEKFTWRRCAEETLKVYREVTDSE